ncbi:MAG: AbrB/MazE/SpoVT family DNA-binding domain-containing protein [Candidatus Woesearchaeota archaeon]
MKLVVSKWGNSYAVRLPKKLVEELEVQEKSILEVKKEKKGFLVKKQKEAEELELMLKNMTPRKELDWGDKRGKEVW